MSGILEPAVIWTLSKREKPHLLLHNFRIRSENGFGHFEEQLKRKKLFEILFSAVRKLHELSILLLLITNYSPAYLSFCVFILCIYLFNYTSGGRSLLRKSTLSS